MTAVPFLGVAFVAPLPAPGPVVAFVTAGTILHFFGSKKINTQNCHQRT